MLLDVGINFEMNFYLVTDISFGFNDGDNRLGKQWIKFKMSINFSREESQSSLDFTVVNLDYQHFNHDLRIAKIDRADWLAYAYGTNLILNEDYTVGYLQSKNKKADEILLGYLFYTHAVQRHMIQLHSSLISNNGRGLMFLGPSGIGKTTQAELWNKYRDALIINGDIVFVQETKDAFLGWGTPWHGSSPYCENTSVPVHAMIVLKQAPENSIRELTGFEKVSEVSNSVFYPRWLENGMELCLETLDHLLSKIPVYELSCRPDEDAVRLVEETVFK